MYCIKKYRYLASWENPSSPTCSKSWSDAVERWSNVAGKRVRANTYEVRVVNIGQDCIFRDNVIDLSEFDNVGLLQTLHGIEVT